MIDPTTAPAWAAVVPEWEARGHVGPIERFPETVAEETEGILWCRRCCRLIYVRGALAKSGAAPCVPARIEPRARILADPKRPGRSVVGTVIPLPSSSR